MSGEIKNNLSAFNATPTQFYSVELRSGYKSTGDQESFDQPQVTLRHPMRRSSNRWPGSAGAVDTGCRHESRWSPLEVGNW